LLRQAARGSPHPSRPTGLWQISRSCGYFLFLRPAPTPVINVQKQGGCSTSAKCYRPLDASRASFQILPPPVRLPFWTGFFAGVAKKGPCPNRGTYLALVANVKLAGRTVANIQRINTDLPIIGHNRRWRRQMALVASQWHPSGKAVPASAAYRRRFPASQ
jgi:hypothetical protein